MWRVIHRIDMHVPSDAGQPLDVRAIPYSVYLPLHRFISVIIPHTTL